MGGGYKTLTVSKMAQNRSKWFILLLYCLFKFGDMDMGPLPRQNDGRAKSLFTIYNHMANWFLGEKEGCCNVKALIPCLEEVL